MPLDAPACREIHLSRLLVQEVLRVDNQFPRVVPAPVLQMAWAAFGVTQLNKAAPAAALFLSEELRLSRLLSNMLEHQDRQFPKTVPISVLSAYAPLKRHYSEQIAEGAVD